MEEKHITLLLRVERLNQSLEHQLNTDTPLPDGWNYHTGKVVDFSEPINKNLTVIRSCTNLTRNKLL